MGIFKTAADYVTGKRALVKNNIASKKQYYLKRADKTEDKFCSDFFQHVITCIVTDAYEYFLEVDTENNFFYQNIQKLDDAKGDFFFMLEAMYHTMLFLDKKGNQVEPQKVEEALFYTFEFNDQEKEIYNYFKELLETNPQLFEVEFSSYSATCLFDHKDLDQNQLAFIYNYYYNSYSDFIASFTKYVSIKSRIKVN